jgi:hypothetical protein
MSLPSLRRLLGEPLLHFVLLGAALFAAFSLVSERDQVRDDQIVVSAGKIEHLATLFERTRQRPPTRAELDGLIDDFVREEAAYREGMAVGLDTDDSIIRRRVRQKLDFIAEDLAGQVEPTDEDLAVYLATSADDFRRDARVTFRHVFLDPQKRGDDLDAEARDLLIALDADPSPDPATLGDRILLEHGYADIARRDVAGLFGGNFAAAVVALEPGAWHGPIESGYGVHLVRVDERTEGRLPPLAEVREAVRREWKNVQRAHVIETFYRDLVDRYEVVIEWPP